MFIGFSSILAMAMSPPQYCIIAALFLFFISSLLLSSSALDHITRGSSLAVEDHETNFLVSGDGSFACGFHEVGDNAFAFAIWFKNSADRTTAWAANRDRPVNGHGSRISLRKDGRLELTDLDGTVVWSTNTSSSGGSSVVAAVKLFDTGNLAVVDTDGNNLWRSFDSPTDTLLVRQPITRYTPLVSSSSRGSISSGFYRFYFDSDNVLRLIYDGPEISSIYWPYPLNNVWQNGRSNYNSSRMGSFDEAGQFSATDKLKFNASDYGHGVTRRLTLDYDGNLRLYSLNEQQRSWSVTWQALQQPCDIHGTCGHSALCVHGAKAKYCSCLPGFDVIDSSDLSKGCRRKYNFSCQPDQNHYLEIPLADFWGFDLDYRPSISFAECRKMCSHSCECQAFGYKKLDGLCYLKNVLFSGRSSPVTTNTIYLKIPRSVPLSQFSVAPSVQPLVCNDTKVLRGSLESYRATGGTTKWEYFYGFVSAIFVMEAVFIACGWWFIFRREQVLPLAAEEGYSVISSQFRRFTYAELKKATKNFKDVLGSGGSGVVYRGVFQGDRVMAVKKLEDVIQGEEEFQAELSLIGRINQKNLVRIVGFCSERRHRLLVSEFVENGSLDKYMFDGGSSAATPLGWKERFKIAVGVAKGLAYLHHECLEWIIHCDVKPENILLDQGFEPKIADFGLAKLLNRGGGGGGGSNLSRIRGTRGYIAPEWASSLPIDGKVDVYSYGVVVLELVKGERVSSWVVDGAEEVALVLRRRIAVLKEKLAGGEEGWVGEFVDHRLDGEVNWSQALVLLQVALSCLEEERSRRPSMDSVVQMLLFAVAADDETDDPGII